MKTEWLDILFHPEDGDDTLIQNVSEIAENYTELQTR
jgi:hypothetical protein